jgi:hypothetical protein
LIYLALKDGGRITIAEITESYGNVGAASHDTANETIDTS